MATLRDIQRRIRSVQSTQKITRAMKLVAAAKLRRAQERITEARPYANRMRELLGSLVSRAGGEGHPLLARRTTGRTRLVIITADKGLCGAFNSNVLRASLQFLREAGEVDVTLVVVGKKSRDFYRRRQWAVKSEMLGVFDRLAFSHAQELAGELIQAYLAEQVDAVHLIYNEFRSVAVQRVRREQLLPIQADGAGTGDGAATDYLYEPSAGAILASLLPRHVTTQVYRALMESVAGEHGARMTAMEAATKNAKEMIGVLTIQYNKARQERITKELLDIVGGAEALRQSAEN
ncbi:MAG: ATP synthase F1 subunit gamma [Candidatus Rokubacteria bacterium GWC2_70_16]|nr:MAG: ATP synthase F1 subunit gamma [Candidatus Rokubacteria bacterium GWC2_70_16]OGL14075.1 MAG: ATP synthase F1 subunit gamma [Candidatus Rokubacteria bacterium RIFCSPLOWO2_12_FULL_71_19]